MATEKDLLKEPILPNKGAAGVKIGARTQVVKDLWGEPLEIEQIRPDFVRWSLVNQPPFGIGFDFDMSQPALQRVTGIYVFRE